MRVKFRSPEIVRKLQELKSLIYKHKLEDQHDLNCKFCDGTSIDDFINGYKKDTLDFWDIPRFFRDANTLYKKIMELERNERHSKA